jgi:hypothetical protein
LERRRFDALSRIVDVYVDVDDHDHDHDHVYVYGSDLGAMTVVLDSPTPPP